MKITTTIALLLGLIGAAQAQSGVSLGLKGGVSYTSLEGDDAQEEEYRWGFHAGGFVTIRVNDLLSFQPEILYSQKGATTPLRVVSGVIGERELRLQYIDVPLPLRVNAGGLFFEAGPQVGLLVAAQSKSLGVAIDVKDTSSDIDLGYLVGLGYQLESGPGIGLRYNSGVSSVYKYLDLKARHSAFQLYLLYSFGSK